jgi:hypothetical protein
MLAKISATKQELFGRHHVPVCIDFFRQSKQVLRVDFATINKERSIKDNPWTTLEKDFILLCRPTPELF